MSKPKILTDEQFRESAKKGEAPAEAQIRKGFITEVKDTGEDNRTLDFVISTDAVDRCGDTIAVDGWQLANFRKNPVVLWAHDATIMPVAKASNIRVEDGKLKARAEFMSRDISGFADAVYRALQGGFLSATSVGFAPLKYSFSEEDGRTFGIDFLQQELLEFSIVPVPANQEALIESRSAAQALAHDSPLREWIADISAKAGVSMIPKKQLDAIMGLPARFRELAGKLPDKAKGARGQLLRCANIAEKQLKAEAVVAEDEITPPEEQPAAAPTETPRLTMAQRRFAVLRRKTG